MIAWWPEVMYILAGLCTGLLSGIFGIGGGVIVVPALVFIFELNPTISPELTMHLAAGSSLAVMMFTSLATIRAHNQVGPILWNVYGRLWKGIVLGTMLGAILASELSTTILKILFAIFLLFIAYKMLTHTSVKRAKKFPPKWTNRLVSFFIGLKSGLLGVGGGVLIIPYLTYCGVEPRRIAAISSLCTMTVAWVGTTMFMLTHHAIHGPPYSTGYVYWPAVVWVAITSALMAPLGVKLSYVLPVSTLRYIFVGVLILTAIGMLM